MASTRSSLLCLAMGLVLFSMNFDVSKATEFEVGGKENSWRIPTTANGLNEWAEKERFKIGDVLGNVLLFSYHYIIAKSIVCKC